MINLVFGWNQGMGLISADFWVWRFCWGFIGRRKIVMGIGFIRKIYRMLTNQRDRNIINAYLRI